MEKFYKATVRVLGGKPNGTGQTSCFHDASLVKVVVLIVSVAFSAGALSFGFRGLPSRVKAVEDRTLKIETISQSIDARLARIEQALINK